MLKKNWVMVLPHTHNVTQMDINYSCLLIDYWISRLAYKGISQYC